MPDRVISVPQATQIAQRIKNKFDNVNGRLQRQQGIIAEAFSAQSTYNVGDSVIYEAGLYTFKTDKSAGAWDATKVDGPFKVTNELSSLKSDLDYLSAAENTPLTPGYINSIGVFVPPTSPEAQVTTEYIPVMEASHFIVDVAFNTVHYRSMSINGFDKDKAFVEVLAKYETGNYSEVIGECTIAKGSSVRYIRVSFNGYDDYINVDTKVFVNGVSIIENADYNYKTILSNIDELRDLCGIKYQYIDSTAWENGYYYNVSGSIGKIVKNASGTTWNTQAIANLPAGTYHYNKFCTRILSFVEKVSDGTITKVSDLIATDSTNGTITIDYEFNLYLTINSQYYDTDTSMFASGNLPSEYVYGWYKDESASNYVNAQGQSIYVVGVGRYPTIQSACDAANENDIIFIRCGTYTEQVAIWNKKLHLVGESKENTILIDHSGNYNTPPLEMSLGSLSNMTIIEDGTTPTVEPSDSAYNMAYCIHIEWQPPTSGEVLRINNCDFINYIHAPLGCGLYQDYTVHFKDCTFRCEAQNEGTHERGAFYFHSNIHENITGQKIIAENCIISSAGTRWAVLLGVPSGANNTGSAEARFSGCTIWNDNVGVADSIAKFDTSGGTDVLRVVNSYGNTVSALNNNEST